MEEIIVNESSTKMRRIAMALGIIVLAAVAASGWRPDPATAGPNGRMLPLRFVGTVVGEVRDLSAITDAPGADEALCFDSDIIDAATGHVIGTATDCLFDIQEVGDGSSLTAVTFFNLPGGTVISQGHTTVQPVTIGSPDFTHITGAVPPADANTVIGGTGRFANAHGRARLSGAVNLSRLEDFGEITFDCVFVLDFD